jgi:hypothetical protein
MQDFPQSDRVTAAFGAGEKRQNADAESTAPQQRRWPMSGRTAAALACLALGAGLAGAAWAADPVTDAMQAAYAPYRAALFRTNGSSQAESQQALAQAQQAWARLATQFGPRPPAPYDRDTTFAAALSAVDRVYAKAQAEVGANQLSRAHETLEEAREIMADLRRRNQVVTYSDHMNAYHAEMEQVLGQSAKMLSLPDGMARLTARAGALNYLAGRLSSDAPASQMEDAEFKVLLQAVETSVRELQSALFAQDPVAARAALGKLKPAYSKLFLKFG